MIPSSNAVHSRDMDVEPQKSARKQSSLHSAQNASGENGPFVNEHINWYGVGLHAPPGPKTNSKGLEGQASQESKQGLSESRIVNRIENVVAGSSTLLS